MDIGLIIVVCGWVITLTFSVGLIFFLGYQYGRYKSSGLLRINRVIYKGDVADAVTQALEAERLEIAKVVCSSCRDEVPLSLDDSDYHISPYREVGGFQRKSLSKCSAAGIRNRSKTS